MFLIDGQSLKLCDRNGGITGQPFRQCRRQVGQWHSARGERVVAGDRAGRIDRDVTGGCASTYILGRLLRKVPIECRGAAGKAGSIILGAERLDLEGCLHRDPVIMRACTFFGASTPEPWQADSATVPQIVSGP